MEVHTTSPGPGRTNTQHVHGRTRHQRWNRTLSAELWHSQLNIYALCLTLSPQQPHRPKTTASSQEQPKTEPTHEPPVGLITEATPLTDTSPAPFLEAYGKRKYSEIR